MRIGSLFALNFVKSPDWKLRLLFLLVAGGLAFAGSADALAAPRKARLAPDLAERALAFGGTRIADYGSYQLFELPAEAAMALPAEKVELLEDSGRIFLPGAVLDTGSPRSAGWQPAGPPIGNRPVLDPLAPSPTLGLTPPPALLPQEAESTAAAPHGGKRLHLVQFAGPIKLEWVDGLKSIGLRIINYLPENAYLVYGNNSQLQNLGLLAANAPHIQFEGEYDGPLKTPPLPAGGSSAEAQAAALSPRTYAVQLLADSEVNAATLALLDVLKQAPFERQHAILDYLNIVVSLVPEAVKQVAARPDVISIQPYAPRRKLCERQGQILAGNVHEIAAGASWHLVPTGPGYLAWLASKGFTQEQFDASGLVVDISDSGIDDGTALPNHFALYPSGALGGKSRVVYNRLIGTPNSSSTLAGCDGHGTLNAHIVAGYVSRSGFPFTDYEGYHYGLGICPFVRVGSSVVFDPDYFTNPDLTNLMARAYHDGARISNQSWGGDASGPYDIDAQAFDILVRDAQLARSPYPTPGNQEMVIIVAAGNDGPDFQTVSSPATAKNVIAVGAGENVQAIGGTDSSDVTDSQANSASDMVAFSSRGPCRDGRHKPDLVAAGTHVSGGVYQGTAPGATGSAAGCFDGTGVSGGAGSDFFPAGQEYFTASSGTSHSAPAVAGGAALLRQWFINHSWGVPSPAMTKAYLINSARHMTGASANDTLWSDKQGMGSLNLGTAFDGVPRALRDQEAADLLTASGQVRTFTGNIADPSRPLRVTLAWTDAPGSTAGNAYNNDLDLVVTVGSVIYKGNVFSGAQSSDGGQADRKNNVESVFLPAGVTGPFMARVVAANINSDGVPHNAHGLDQDFALVIYNGTLEARPVLEPGEATVVGESFPANSAIDPGETVNVSMRLRNTGTASTTNLTATLQEGGGVSSPGPAQYYGALTTGGAAVERTFAFAATGECGGTLTATLQLQDGLKDLGTVVFKLGLGKLTTATTFAEDFDSSGALPFGWTANANGGSPWTISSSGSDTAPNAATVAQSPHSGFAEILSPTLQITSSVARLTFRMDYDLEADDVDPAMAYDGGVLEIKIGNGAWTDILDAGGSFVNGGYTRTVDPLTDNPFAGRSVWSGKSGGYVTCQVDLPAAAAGSSIQLRWRLGTDTENFFGGTGWSIDTISVVDGRYLCYVARVAPKLKNVKIESDQVSFSLESVNGQQYVVETSEHAGGGPWTILQSFTGNGATMTVTDTVSGAQKYYRVKTP